jgi:transposase-like protein
MKKQTRRKFSAAFKAKVALEAVKNQQTLAELAKKFELNPVMISKWKAEFLENLSATFEREESVVHQEQDTEKLYAAIGQLKVENEFLKKSCKKLGIEI